MFNSPLPLARTAANQCERIPRMRWRDVVSFLRATGSDPSMVGAIAPSGPALARLMTRDIGRQSGLVVELGPGTGVFTRALLKQGVREKDLTLVECCPEFVVMLREEFPEARVLHMDAGRPYAHELFLKETVGAVVSGIPLLNLSPASVLRILTRVFRWLRPSGAFYQFTYGPRCPISRRCLERLGLSATCTGRALANLPPASVYRISKRAEMSEFDSLPASSESRSPAQSPGIQQSPNDRAGREMSTTLKGTAGSPRPGWPMSSPKTRVAQTNQS